MSVELDTTAMDAAIGQLLLKISDFSDDYFDASWLHLRESEVEALAVQVILYCCEHLEGRLLGSLLLAIREGD